MPSISKSIKAVISGVIKHWDYSVLPDWESQWWRWSGHFYLNDQKYEIFCHNYNCGWPPARMTERSVELAIADRWLQGHDRDEIYEIGAVTPYYWPHRVKHIVDPFDDHALVTHKESLFNVSLDGKAVISISTVEHIGVDEYGQEENPALTILALEKIFSESRSFCITAPLGYNIILDNYIKDKLLGCASMSISFLARGLQDNIWLQVDHSAASRAPYGPRDYSSPGSFANAIVVLSKET
jgi:hypothetical protein